MVKKDEVNEEDNEEKVKKGKEKEDKKEEAKLSDIPGIGPGTVTKLEAAGVYDLMGLAVMSPTDLSELAGVGPAVARKAIQAARGMMQLGFTDGAEFDRKRKDIHYITTGSKNFDGLLGGKGLESKAITEAYGAFGSGKTQLGLTLAVNVQLPLEHGGANGKAVYIDTEGTFRPDRIRQIAESIGANSEKVLKNILVARAFNSDHQILLLDKITELIKEQKEPIKLIIIDSLTAHFRAEFAGRGQLADRQQRLNRYLHQLMKVAEQSNLTVFVTNQVMSNPAMMFGDPTTAIGGNIVGHACLTGNSLIQLADGDILEIKDMAEGSEVISSSFEKMELSREINEKVFVNPGIKDIYNIKTNCQINCSDLHRFFTIENFAVVEKEARDLDEGDFVAQARRIDIMGDVREIPKFKIKKIGKIDLENGKVISDKLKEKEVSREEICGKIGITPRQFRRVINQEYPTSMEVFDNLKNHFGNQQLLQIMPVYTNKHKNLMMPEFLSPALGQIFGYFIGDGNFEKSGLRFRDERLDVLQVYQKLFKKEFNVVGKITKMKNKNCHTLYINSKEIRDLFVFMMGNIYNEVGKSKIDVVESFAKGFIDAEGHINKKRAYISVSQKDDKVLRYLQMYLMRSGIRATIKFGIGKKKMNVLRIIDKDVSGFLKIGFSACDKQKRLVESIAEMDGKYFYEMMPVGRGELRDLLESCGLNYSKIIKSRPESYKWVSRKELENAFRILMNCEVKDRQIKQKINFIFKLLNSNLSFERIREIKISKNDGKVLYDFSVPSKENYIANGFVVHNSTYRIYLRRGKQGSRVAKLIDSPNLPDNECQFYVTEGGVKDEL
jgi:DNA repair protein RadA